MMLIITLQDSYCKVFIKYFICQKKHINLWYDDIKVLKDIRKQQQWGEFRMLLWMQKHGVQSVLLVLQMCDERINERFR